MAYAGQMIRFFISSTFHDMHQERNTLQLQVFPRLREFCREQGIRFQAIDLRWGVSQEASQDQRTLMICLDEIRRCREVSPHFNFLVLLGDRHGSDLLPERISQAEFEMLLDLLTIPDRQTLRPWYRLDSNALAPVYVLQPWSKEQFSGYEAWASQQRVLHDILAKAAEQAGLDAATRLKYLASATEMEIEEGVFHYSPREQEPLCFFRTITGEPRGENVGLFIEQDARKWNRLEAIKQRLEKRCAASSLYKYSAPWVNADPSGEYLSAFSEKAYELLKKRIEASIQSIGQARSGAGIDLEKSAFQEFADERVEHFVERAESDTIETYLAGNSIHPLIVTGPSGSGKSTLLAHTMKAAYHAYPDTHIEEVYIGVTPASAHTRGVLDHLCRQITRAYDGDEATIPSDEAGLIEEFPERLKLATPARPLLICIDALDQLARRSQRVDWIPKNLPAYVRMVVSILADTEAEQEALHRDFSRSQVLTLGKMTREQGDKLLSSWLDDAGRTLQPAQRDTVLDRFAIQGLPLYLRLVFEEARLWPSYLKAISDFKTDIAGILKDLFERLAQDAYHGPVLVAHCLGFLRAAKNGLSEDEMLDLLRADQEVLRDIKRIAPESPVIDPAIFVADDSAPAPQPLLAEKDAIPFPVVLWSRLSFDLNAYLTERNADGTRLIGFYHQQLGEVVEQLYLQGSAKLARHQALAHYFHDQPLLHSEAQNLRKMSEQPFQQTEGELWNDLYKTLTDFQFLEQKAKTGKQERTGGAGKTTSTYSGIYDLQRDFEAAIIRWRI